ncbi:unnamed protein product [Schistocephalus solidus]|uniref:Protein tyrosine phosphatase domain-containing protein 1 n=1 Tax=Schistocephalus solidus TaxID=70667 RepID=A0A183STQ2_SCHSO|nr:unnamed protein product [Schistocephalus solidus]
MSEGSPLLSYSTQTSAIRPKTSTSSSDEEEEEDEVDSTSGQQQEDEIDEGVPDVDFTSQWLDPQGLVNHVVNKGLTGLSDEYTMICRIKPNDPCTAFHRSCNSSKNRYVDVSCLEKTRVLLQGPPPPPTPPSASSKAGKTEKSALIYIHANWVDSYRQKNAFICTQGKNDGPLLETAGDFWYMMWTYNVPVIVMITRCYESQRCKCYQYWPASPSQTLRFFVTTSNSRVHTTAAKKPSHWLARRSASEVSSSGKLIFDITNLESTVNEDYTRSKLEMKDIKSGRTRVVEHFAFHSWPDHGVPTDTTALLGLLSTVQTTYATFIRERLNYTSAWDQPIPPPPIVVHCSAGIGRTGKLLPLVSSVWLFVCQRNFESMFILSLSGTFIALDVCTKQLSELARVNVPLTVSRIRLQRFGSVQVSAQYIFVYRAILDFAVSKGILTDSECEKAKMQLQPRPLPTSVEGIFENLDARILSALSADPAQLESLVNLLQSRSVDDRGKLSTARVPGTTDSDYEDDENDEVDCDSKDDNEADEDDDDYSGGGGDADHDQNDGTNNADQGQLPTLGAKAANVVRTGEKDEVRHPSSQRPLPCISTNYVNVSHADWPLVVTEIDFAIKTQEPALTLPPLLVQTSTKEPQSPHSGPTTDLSPSSEVRRRLPALLSHSVCEDP